MAKRALNRDLLREIGKTRSRFFSIMMLVMIAVCFLFGLRMAAPDMKASMDAYLDEQKLMDVHILSTLGLTEEDVAALRGVEGTLEAEGFYTVDALAAAANGQDTLVVKAISLGESGINAPNVVRGRLPAAEEECLVEESLLATMGLELGSQITLDTGSGTYQDALTRDTYTIVGAGKSPLYISLSRGSSTLGNGSVSAVITLSPAAYDMETYTDLYLRVEDAERYNAYNDDYEDLIARYTDQLEALRAEREEARTREVKEEAQAEIDDAWTEYRDAEAEADEELAEAWQELTDAKQELDDGWTEYEDGTAELEDARKEVADGEARLSDAKETLERGEREYSDGWKEYQDGKTAYEEGLTQYQAGKAQYDSGRRELESRRAEYEAALAEYEAGEAAYAEGEAQYEAGELAYAEGAARYEAGEAAYAEGYAQYEAGESAYAEGAAQYEAGEAAYASQRAEYERAWAALAEEYGQETADAMLAEEKEKLESGRAQLDATKKELESSRAQLDATKVELAAGRSELDESKEALASNRTQLDATKETLEGSRGELDAAKETLTQARTQLDAGEAELDAAGQELSENQGLLERSGRELSDAKDVLADSRKQLDSGWKDYHSGQEELETARQEIADGERELEDAYTELTDGQKEYEDGLLEYQDGEADAEQELTEAREEIEDAQHEVDTLEGAEWYVLDRTANMGFASYQQDAQRMTRLAALFPTVFFLVAALVCLTAMTRMVEEQRVQIGALKALGYSKLDIARKYVGYGLLASLTGGVIGLLLGGIGIPWVIVSCWKVMYDFPGVTLTFEWRTALVCLLAAVACCTVAVLVAALAALRATPAELMRPRAPQPGKRVWLEYIPAVWKRLSFSQKVTARNLFRYKKRFWMTVIGIAGCTGLMITGFGLYDSIMDVIGLQYDHVSTYSAILYTDGTLEGREREELLSALEEEPDLECYVPCSLNTVTLESDTYSLDGNLLVADEPDSLEGFWNFRDRKTGAAVEMERGGALISEKTAQLLGLSEGDPVTVVKDNRRSTVKVTGIVENYVQHYLYLTRDAWEAASGERVEDSQVLLTYGDGADWEAMGERLLALEMVSGVYYISDTKEMIYNQLQGVYPAVVIIICAAAALAFVVLYNLSSINITERIRELATLRVLGFRDGELRSYVFRENLVLTLLGMLLGLLLGKWFHSYLITTVEVEAVMFGRTAHPLSYILSLLLTIGFALLVNLAAGRRLSRIDMVESLKTVE